MASMDISKELNMHLMGELSSISNLDDSIWHHTMVTIIGEKKLLVRYIL